MHLLWHVGLRHYLQHGPDSVLLGANQSSPESARGRDSQTYLRKRPLPALQRFLPENCGGTEDVRQNSWAGCKTHVLAVGTGH